MYKENHSTETTLVGVHNSILLASDNLTAISHTLALRPTSRI